MNSPGKQPGIAYRALDHTNNDFRLLFLTPTAEHAAPSCDDIVIGELQHYCLKKAPPFVALSYCWGKAATQSNIEIDGMSQRCGFNGEVALRHLRRTEGVYVWIDQLCINQNDNAEKAHQVSMMRQIYSTATRVAVWLGLPDDDSDMVLRHIRDMCALIRKEKYLDVVRFHTDIAFLRRVSHAFRAFCKREYWSRVWIIQEFAVAREIDIICGHASIGYADLREFIVFLNKLNEYNPKIQEEGGSEVTKTPTEMLRGFKTSANSFLEAVLTRRRRYQTRHGVPPTNQAIPALEGFGNAKVKDSESLFAVLVTTLVLEIDYNHSEATDHRDRIFAVMQFADDVLEFEGLPNYTLSCEKVYRDVARRILMQGNIDLLSYCQFPRDKSLTTTWAPDWKMRIKRPNTGNPWHSKFDASKSSIHEQVVVAPDSETIQLRGVLVDVITEIGNVWNPSWIEELDCKAAPEYISEVRKLCEKSPMFAQKIKDADLKDVMRICIADRYQYREPERQKELLEAYAEAVSRMTNAVRNVTVELEMGIEMVDTIGWQQPWFMFVMKNLHSRRLFLSESGYVGLAPMHAQPGDKIVILLEGKTPYTVRETDAGHHELVGESYVHGVMFGEFMTDDVEVRDYTFR
ncbi:heterokaryon incompatibility protein 6, OR allele [Colletotrichum spaethianum]|uniref:Heterokaryon incompatibility protein 6, OR allele n=1 Tax=Colletotrichum spaethianum TaxID=700344 RepID=A0AA37L6N9_9PEZI|nr:heterokaryon incompatibility protein 6, OR allele [Colletotrichum spaethianum]GKT42868.1 heterokaryon incompatibility protein 6, OR allele [Colletotrichum spaethianum]